MRYGIECRAPFLTPDLAGLVLSLPGDLLIGEDGETKRVLREAMRGLVPPEILSRRDKIGFATPEQEWLGAAATWIGEVLADGRNDCPAIETSQLRRRLLDAQQGTAPLDPAVWRALNVLRWTQLNDVAYEA